ncbi:hypothetical protein [Streptomyces solicathayae]|uniref:Uncharacterized protein n=1 Tax=Streptomyces solicathayae TaxID=3081768 RepID=A0ABZ0LP88_9ACTN|nr:hypothetical protein [Streptomyces sp. HUAS YS2]WOX21308.1 hypothetical protein R2D22_07880 [Streptomyces sp. HUAS YS2]
MTVAVLPAEAHQQFGNGLQLPVLMEPGTYAVEPEPWGPPWRRWNEFTEEEAAARGVYAPVFALSDGLPGAIVVAPGDSRGTVLIPESAGGYCCGLAWTDGPNMACERCGLEVAARVDDCSLWQAVWFLPDAVRRVPFDGPAREPDAWTDLLAKGHATPASEPMARWAQQQETLWWRWSPRWEAAAGGALAHLLVASEGRPVIVPDGRVAHVFRNALDTLLPAGPPPKRAVLAGPGLPAPGEDADIVLVPVHPQTGETWAAPAGTTADVVPIPGGVWLSMAFPERGAPVPATGGLPDGVLRDDPSAPQPMFSFRIDRRAFLRTLSRLPAVRAPWLREIYDEVDMFRHTDLF